MKILSICFLALASLSLSAQAIENVKPNISTDSTKQLLYIIDGVKINNDGWTIGKTIDPKDITSIHVLKGDSAISRYGTSGKNGVILIYTKKAKIKESGLPH